MTDVKNPELLLEKLTLNSLIKEFKKLGDSIKLAEGFINEIAMYRAIIEPIQLIDFSTHPNGKYSFVLQFQLSPNFLLQNYGFLVGGASSLKWQLSLLGLKKSNRQKLTKARDWLTNAKVDLISMQNLNINDEYFKETIIEF